LNESIHVKIAITKKLMDMRTLAIDVVITSLRMICGGKGA